MLAKAKKDFQANRPPVSQRNAKGPELAKQLFPSSSPSQPPADIRDQLKWRGPPRFLDSSPSTARFSRPQCKQPDEKSAKDNGATNGNGAGKGSLASLYRNSSSSFQENVVDLTADDTAKARQPEVFFVEDDFSDDNDLDLDFKVPSAVSPSEVTSISQFTAPQEVLSKYTSVSRSALQKENIPPQSSEQQIPWSSSPASHLLPPQPRNESTLSARSSSSLKRDSPEPDDCFETPAPTKPTKRILPSDWKKNEAPETPAEKAQARGLWDQSASAIKDQKKQLKNQRSTKQEVSEAEALADAAIREQAAALAQRSASIALSSEQRHVLDLVVEQGQSVFFTGPAGTGKSVLMRAIFSELKTQPVATILGRR